MAEPSFFAQQYATMLYDHNEGGQDRRLVGDRCGVGGGVGMLVEGVCRAVGSVFK